MTAPPEIPPHARIVELRQYTLVPGRRDELIELFDREFVVPQEDVGMHVVGQFRDLDDPDRFVWLRGFESTSSRADGLTAFYYGPVWARHCQAANATMIDSDNVLLLRPVCLGPSYPLFGRRDAVDRGAGLLCADIFVAEPDDCPPGAVPGAELADALTDALTDAGADVVGLFETSGLPNNFPQLPIRNDTAVVALTRFADSAELAEFMVRTRVGTPYHLAVVRAFGGADLTVERRRLRPTAMSQLR